MFSIYGKHIINQDMVDNYQNLNKTTTLFKVIYDNEKIKCIKFNPTKISRLYCQNVINRIKNYDDIYFKKHIKANMSIEEVSLLKSLSKIKKKQMKLKFDKYRNDLFYVIPTDQYTVFYQSSRRFTKIDPSVAVIKIGKAILQFMKANELKLNDQHTIKHINKIKSIFDLEFDVFYKPGTKEIIVSDKNRHNRGR